MPKILNEQEITELLEAVANGDVDLDSVLNDILIAYQALRDVVKAAEWEGASAPWNNVACPSCRRQKHEGHVAGCKLAEALGGE